MEAHLFMIYYSRQERTISYNIVKWALQLLSVEKQLLIVFDYQSTLVVATVFIWWFDSYLLVGFVSFVVSENIYVLVVTEGGQSYWQPFKETKVWKPYSLWMQACPRAASSMSSCPQRQNHGTAILRGAASVSHPVCNGLEKTVSPWLLDCRVTHAHHDSRTKTEPAL